MITGKEEVQCLARCLNERDDSGRRRAVPVLGHGINIQAHKEARVDHKEHWAAALDRILRELPRVDRLRLARMPQFSQAIFDELEGCFGKHRRGGGSEKFRVRLSRNLKLLSSGDRTLKLYEDLRAAEFRHILTSCVDDSFVRAVGARRRTPPGVYYESELYRKTVFRLGGPAHPTDIWQINGSIDAPMGIRLGTFSHAAVIAELESQRIRLMYAWRDGSGKLMLPMDFARRSGPFAFNWFKQFMVLPLIFIGTSLDLSDWTMWWLLHQRARIFTVFPPEHRPATFVLTSAEEPHSHLDGRPAGINHIRFASFAKLWSAVRTLLRNE